MIWYPFGTDIKENNEGPPGPPGSGFKLTDDGDYDMERKILKNVKGPFELSDSATKGYVDVVNNDIKSKLVSLSESSLILSKNDTFDAKNKRIVNLDNPVNASDVATMDYVNTQISELESKSLIQTSAKIFNARGKIIGNVDDPISSKNVVNKQYFERNALVLENDKFNAQNKLISNVKNPENNNDVVTKEYLESNALSLNNGVYNAKAIRLTNLSLPADKNDAVTKNYLDIKVKINDKKEDNLLTRDNDGLYVPSLIKNGVYDFENTRLTKVKNPIINTDVATKDYIDNRIFYASINENYTTYTTGGYKEVKFNKFSSKLLTPEMTATVGMDMKIIIFLNSPEFVKPLIKLTVAGHAILIRPIDTNVETAMIFTSIMKDRAIKLFISPDGDENKLRPQICIEKINYL